MSDRQMTTERKPQAKLRQDIDENLKRVFDDALEDEIPDRFKKLLAELKAKEAKK